MTGGNHDGVPTTHREKQQHQTEEMDARVVQPLPPYLIVIFGATGDLAKRKLLPGMLRLFQSELMPEFRVLGTSVEEIDNEEFREIVHEACEEFGRHQFSEEDWSEFARRIVYIPVSAGPEKLKEAVDHEVELLGPDTHLLHYLSVPPAAATDVIHTLGDAGLTENARVIMEKPFGTDLASARKLNDTLHQVLREEQIFRIDHFLGKEAAQNILALRFANGLFEPIWNRDHIDHIQIDVPETLGVGSRAKFYEKTGAFRDMVVTHLMQILAFVAMEPPTELASLPITEEKNKVFRSLLPLDPAQVVRGQYEGYRDEPGVDPGSSTETFVALNANSTTGAGAACPSTCAPASGWAKARGSSRSPSASRRSRCSRPTRGSAAMAPTTSPSTSTSPPASRSPSTASGRGWGWCSTRRACSSRSRKPTTATTPWRPTSG